MQNNTKTIQTIAISSSLARALRFSHYAMATTFEIFIIHEDSGYAQQAAFAAFKVLDQCEQNLSRFIPNSDISRINQLQRNEREKIDLLTFKALQHCMLLSNQTAGAFDINIGDVNIRSHVFDLSKDPEKAGQDFLNKLIAYIQ